MVLASMQESEGVSWPPWEIAPCGVVSLLTMLDFSAKLYVEMSYQFGVMLANLAKIEANTTNWGDGLGQLIKDVKSLGLPVTYEQFNQMVIELIQANPGKVTYEDGQLRFKDMDINPQRFAHHLETLYSTMKAELGAVQLKAVPRERSKYLNTDWLKGTVIEGGVSHFI